MVSPVHAELVITALGSLSQFAVSHVGAGSARDQLRYEHAIAELRAGAMAHVVDALITRRIEVVQEGFVRVLGEYATQAQHYMDQQARFADVELTTSDPLRRIELRKRLNDIDVELRQIRLAAQRIYHRMTEVIIAIGGTSLNMDAPSARYLALPGR